jgi:hypothetical protein
MTLAMMASFVGVLLDYSHDAITEGTRSQPGATKKVSLSLHSAQRTPKYAPGASLGTFGDTSSDRAQDVDITALLRAEARLHL